jgi:hypothetical protein
MPPMTTRLRLPLAALAAAFAALTLAAAPAGAVIRFTLDAHPAPHPANVIRDMTDTAYFAWVHAGGSGPDTPRFCKVPLNGKCTNPINLPIPLSYGESSLDGTDSVAGAFPVFGGGTTIYVVAPRYVHNDVIVYTSTNGGVSFDGGAVIPHTTPPQNGPYSNKTDPTDVLLLGTDFYIGAFNPDLGFSSFGPDEGNFSFSDPGSGGVAGSSLALLSGGKPIEAYWNLSDPRYRILFYRYIGGGPATTEATWTGPTFVTNGYEPHLAYGTKGVFMVAYEYSTASSDQPSVVRVRRFNGTTFTTLRTLATDKRTNLFAGGAIAESPNGGLAVVWPGYRKGDGRYVMRFFASPDGSTFKEHIDVARIGSGYSIRDNARVTVGNGGLGWVTFRDEKGIHVADFTPIKPYVPPPYKGKTKTTSKSVAPGVTVKEKTPKKCVASSQKFPVSIGTKVKKKLAHGRKAKLRKVVIRVDGAKVATIKHKPFRRLVKVQGLPGSKHKVTVSVTLRITRPHHKGKTKKTKLTAVVRVC